MRSRTGCITCRRRKLKCDEHKPRCGQCCKANRECHFGSGIVFRHQQNASMNAESSRPSGGQKGFYAYKNTFDKGSVWLDIPKQITFVNTTNPYADPEPSHLDSNFNGFDANPGPPQGWVAQELDHRVDAEIQVQGLEALSAAALYVPHSARADKPSDDSSAVERHSPSEPSTSFSGYPTLQPSTLPSSSPDNRIDSGTEMNYNRAMSAPIDPALGLSKAPEQAG